MTENKGDLISREALKKEFDDYIKANPNISGIFKVGKFIIDNAPTVETEITDQDIKDALKQGFVDGYEMAKAKYENSQGCETCDYRIFTEKFADGIADVMNQYGIKAIEELQKILEPYCKIARENKEINNETN